MVDFFSAATVTETILLMFKFCWIQGGSMNKGQADNCSANIPFYLRSAFTVATSQFH